MKTLLLLLISPLLCAAPFGEAPIYKNPKSAD